MLFSLGLELEDVAGTCYLIVAWDTGERFAIRGDTVTEPLELIDQCDGEPLSVVW